MAIGGIFKQIQVWQVHLFHDCSNSPERKSTGEITPLPQLHLLVQINVNPLVPVFSTKPFSCQDGCMEPGGCAWEKLGCVFVERKRFLGKNARPWSCGEKNRRFFRTNIKNDQRFRNQTLKIGKKIMTLVVTCYLGQGLAPVLPGFQVSNKNWTKLNVKPPPHCDL